jgi:hypothetical protein
MTTAAPEQLLELPADEIEEAACAAHLGVWTAQRRGLQMAAHHWEWCELAMTRTRLAVVAPRESAKTETFTVNAGAWRSIYEPGCWTYLFAQTSDQAKAILARIVAAVETTRPELVDAAMENSAQSVVFSNGSRIDAAGAGKRVRSAHPDVIIGDDVLDDESTATGHQRRKTEKWWFGTVANMAHPGAVRRIREASGRIVERRMPPTRMHLVGTPFHQSDLLLGMRSNALWAFYRYAAEFWPEQLVPGTLAVEVAA